MGSLSIWHWLIVLVVVILLFGKGKISALMGETAQGVKAFKKGMAEIEQEPAPTQDLGKDARNSAGAPPPGERA